MQRNVPSRRSQVLLLVAQFLGLFAVVYFYVYVRVRPELFYHLQPQVFLLDARFLHGLVSQPGGVVHCLSAFLSPLLAWDWLGSLVVALLVIVICLATRGLMAAVAGEGGEFAYLVLGVLLLMVLGQYTHPIGLCVGLVLALLGANLYFRMGRFHVAIRLAAFLIASVPIYFAAAGYYVIFACLCGSYELTVKRHCGVGTLFVFCAVSIPSVAAVWPFDLSARDAFRGLLLPSPHHSPHHWQVFPSSTPKAVLIYTASLVYPVLAVLVSGLLRRPSARPVLGEENSSGRATASPGAGTLVHLGTRRRWTVPLALLLLVLLADLAVFDATKRCLLEIEYHSEQERWDEVLVWAEALPFPDVRAHDPRILYCINRALYFTGSLLDRMFAYPQTPGNISLALLHLDTSTTAKLTPRQYSELLFDLGRINESEQMAHEALELYGNRPEVLKRLALIYVIKGEPEAARRFLSLLERTLLHGGWARRMQAKLDSDPSLSDMPLVASRRELMVRRDSLNPANDLETLLVGLLESNPGNRMATEYLMAHYLLTRQIDRLAAHRHLFDGRDDPHFPRHVEEALLLHMLTTRQQNLDLGMRVIRPERSRELQEFLGIEVQVREDPSEALTTLYPDFGDNYCFFFVFAHNIPSLGILE